jgi:DNA-binding transcriptional regulator PaaX
MKKSIKNLGFLADKFTTELLYVLNELAKGLPKPFESKAAHQKRLWMLMHGYPKEKVYLAANRLKKQGLVKLNRRYNFLELTFEGKRKLLSERVRGNRRALTNGNSSIVIFDIPEEKAKYRKYLRKILLQNGFINLQKSVLIGRTDLGRDFFDFLDEFGLRQNVTVIQGRVQNQPSN